MMTRDILLHSLAVARPEVWMVLSAFVLLMFGAFRGDRAATTITFFAAAAMAVAIWFITQDWEGSSIAAFGGFFATSPMVAFVKILCLGGAIAVLALSPAHFRALKAWRFEYPVLVLFSVLGMMLMLSANDLMALYVAIELQSLSLYVLASIQRDDARSTESGLKYFILGALSSGLLLYGMSLIYGATGATNFDALAASPALQASNGYVLTGVVFVLAGLCFKVSAVPFHMWTPDVYDGAPTPVTAFFASAPKIAAIGVLFRLFTSPFAELASIWQDIILIVSVLSMVVGAVAALRQTSIKRLLAYSSIGHMGYVLMAVAILPTGASHGTSLPVALLYLAIYLVMTAGTFAVLLSLRIQNRAVETMSDFSGLSKDKPVMAMMMAIFMFSMAGIPPLAGFFAKLYLFLAVVEAGFYPLAVIGVLTSVVAAFYYLKIIRHMYFDAPRQTWDAAMPLPAKIIAYGAGVVTLLFFLSPSWLLELTATRLLPGVAG